MAYFASSPECALEAIATLSDEELERVFVFLSAIAFGQSRKFDPKRNQAGFGLDTNERSVFNRVAIELGVEMQTYWSPGNWFLSRRTIAQLGEILSQSGLSRLFGNGKGYKKNELVALMLRYWNKVENLAKPDAQQAKAKDWLPEALAFPAIDPDLPQEEKLETELSEAA